MTMRRSTSRTWAGRSGQALIFFMIVLVILVFVVLWNYDLNKILFVKSVTQNAGDAAALAAARWQGITLNMVGDLNLMHAMAIRPDGEDADIAGAISNIQARLCYTGPMIAFMAAQQAAKNNGVYQNDDFSRFTLERAQIVRRDYPSAADPDGEPLFPEPYPGCWHEYADMLEFIANEGVAAGPDNARFYTDFTGGHILLMADFYDAIAGRYWCWFYHNAPTLLEDYRNFFPCWWPPLPEPPHREYHNSEIFGLGLTRVVTTLSAFPPDSQSLTNLAGGRGIAVPDTATNFMNTVSTWFVYDPSVWTEWAAMNTGGDDPFPLAGPVKPQYDYAGADAAVRIEATAERITPGPGGSAVRNTITWSAAAKPFGYLNENDRPDSCRLVLPAFHDVALFPVDASSAPSGGSYNLRWREHVEEHLPRYMEEGPSPSGCWYCNQLVTWEDEAFRRAGADWLSSNSWQCVATAGPGRHRGGGTSRGH